MSSNCYRFEEYNTSSILGDNNGIVDATYILTLDGSSRSKTIKKRLDRDSVTNTNYIVHNKNYKICRKPDVKDSTQDIVHACIVIFKHADEVGYQNILLLEDDFIFTPAVRDLGVWNDIRNFINGDRINYHYSVSLGSIVHIKNIFGTRKMDRIILSQGAHALIIPPQSRKLYTELYKKGKIQIHEITLHNDISRYQHHTIQCVQPFEDTENSMVWGKFGIKYLMNKYYWMHNVNLMDKRMVIRDTDKYNRKAHDINVLCLLISIILCFYFLKIRRKIETPNH